MSAMPGRDRVNPAGPGVKLTYDDLVLFPDDGKRHELIDGEHYVTPCPNVRHQQILGELFGFVWTYLQAEPIGRAFLAPFDVVFSRFDVVEPDLLYMSHETAARVLTSQNVQGTPDLVVEIGSPSTRKRDATIKKRLYERAGVAEYWIIEPEKDIVRVFRNADGQFKPPIELSCTADDVLSTPLLPGFALARTRLFRD
jgi:Uma2 family endonuclease